jgi:hypothetical protein
MFNMFGMLKDMVLAKLSYIMMAGLVGTLAVNGWQARTISDMETKMATLQEENATCRMLLNSTVEGSDYENSQVEILKRYIKRIQEARADDPCAPLSDDDIESFFNQLREQGPDNEDTSSPDREDAPPSSSKRSWHLW